MSSVRAALKPLFAFALGGACTILCAEIGLRQFGEPFRKNVSASSGDTNVVCLGNSFTAGIGADPGHSYCDYLQRLVDQDKSLAHFRLRFVNLGESSKNSSMVLRDLDEVIARYRPRIALIMSGEPNLWNRLGLRAFEATRGSRLDKAYAAGIDYLYNIRVYRLVVLAWRGFANSTTNRRFAHVSPENRANLGYRWLGFLYEPNIPTLKQLSAEELAEATASLIAIADHSIDLNPVVPLVLARIFAGSSTNEALKWYRKAITTYAKIGAFPFEVERDIKFWKKHWSVDTTSELNEISSLAPRTPEFSRLRELAERIGYQNLSTLLPLNSPHQPQQDQVAQDLSTMLRSYPAHNGMRRHLYSFYRDQGKTKVANSLLLGGAFVNPLSPFDVYLGMLTEARADNALDGQEIDEVMRKLSTLFPDEAHNFQTGNRASIWEWTSHDLTRISSKLRKAGVMVVWQTYPPLRSGDPQWVDSLIREIAKREADSLVDTYEYLQVKLAQEPNRPRFYSNQFGSRDPHLSNAGNELIAQQLFDQIKIILTAPHEK